MYYISKSNPGTKTAHVEWRDTQKEKVIVQQVNRPLSYPTLIKIVHICSDSDNAAPDVARVPLSPSRVVCFSL